MGFKQCESISGRTPSNAGACIITSSLLPDISSLLKQALVFL